ncbi:hypothetical protein OV208_30160 [Corallococcus sp. bb12-1]|uniref:hypothetical protein n=1 Tax=Corallococcus sp. bb12-1 TaxID=2996784 RepID=UPI002271A72D|nr:hypothetical protein [Corallococcus sp. bb12-1]MCY1045618.1 hypothetical protein [Corallococcus sp. bb12-1]
MLRRLAVLSLCLVFPSIAFAQVATSPDPGNVESFARLVLDAVTARNWALVASLAVVGLVYVLRRFAGAWWPLLRTARAGAVLAVLVAVAGAVSNALIAGEGFTVALLLKALSIGLGAAGGFTVMKTLVFGDAQVEAAEKAGEAAAGEIAGKAAAVAALDALRPGDGR